MERVFGKSLGLAAALLTITLWGSLPVLRNLVHLPPMLTAAVAMATAAVLAQLMAGRNRQPQTGPSLRDPRFWLMGVGGLTGALYFYFLALAEGDPAKVTLVTYTWPLGFILVADRLAGNGLRLRTLMGALVAFSGLAPLVLAGGSDVDTPIVAYLAGLSAGICWILFSLYLRNNSQAGLQDYKRVFAWVAVTALVLHGAFESTPAHVARQDWLVAALIGIGPYGLAFIAWGYALVRSPSSLLGVLTYLVPVISSAFLILAGWASVSVQLLIAVIAIVASAFITNSSRGASAAAH